MSTQIAKCVREAGNWSKLVEEQKYDHKNFDPKRVAKDIEMHAPKLNALIENIRALDEADMRKYGKHFKHFIYSDIRSAYGAKLIASALASHGFDSSKFGLLTSVLLHGKPLGVRFRRELLAKFNKRPDNVYGKNIRIIILDSGFREGIDLFDVKYVHLFEQILTNADQEQAIGRATRFCGQKGLHFEKNHGWPLHVFRYETVLPEKIKRFLLSSDPTSINDHTFFDIFLRYSNIDPLRIMFANELKPLVIFGAVDRFLTRRVHNFEMEGLIQNQQFQSIFSGGSSLSKFAQTQKNIHANFSQYSWPTTKIEDGCQVIGQTKPVPVGTTAPAANQPGLIEFSPTQNFVRNYFTPTLPQKGMLLMHSVGTGKTCSAIAIASNSFEKEGYTIIYVTRHTLKADVWKNMFGNTCSVIIQNMIKKGISIPEAEAKRNRLIKAWMKPMSYKQFSNMLSNKSSLYNDLIERNGKKDPLHKTLIIIDEAHKLNAADVAASEKPDLDAIKKALNHSYKTSGKDSAKIVLMTATPYTDEPMDMMKLLNLMRSEDEKFPEIFEEFRVRYLDDTGKFTKSGRKEFLDEIAGYISYLNREKDVRSFAYPLLKNVHVPLSEYEFASELSSYIKKKTEYNHAEYLLGKLIMNHQKDKETMRKRLVDFLNDMLKKKMVEFSECEENYKDEKKERLAAIREDAKEELEECIQQRKDCEGPVKAEHAEKMKQFKLDQKVTLKEAVKQLRDEAKQTKSKSPGAKERLKAVIEKRKLQSKMEILRYKKDHKEDLDFDKRECREVSTIAKCTEDVNRKRDEAIAALKLEDPCGKIKQEYDRRKSDGLKKIDEEIAQINMVKEKQISTDKKILSKNADEIQNLKRIILEKAGNDRSQQGRLEHCLKPHVKTPYYKQVLASKSPQDLVETLDGLPSPDSVRQTPIELQNTKSIYIIKGHGSEYPVDFEKRQRLPKDKVLVVFPVCGRPNWTDFSCQFMDYFNNPTYTEWFKDPIKYQKTIEKALGFPIRVYLPGDSVPVLATDLISDFHGKDDLLLFKSGVYPIGRIPPINRAILRTTTNNLGSDKCYQFLGAIDNPSRYTAKVHAEVYKGSVYKVKTSDYNELKEQRMYIRDIMDTVGSGIYFYLGCRSSAEIDEDEYMKILDRSAAQQNRDALGSKPARIMRKFRKQLGDARSVHVDSRNSGNSSVKSSRSSDTDSADSSVPSRRVSKTKQEKLPPGMKKLILKEFLEVPEINTKERLEKCQQWKAKLDAKQLQSDLLDDLIVLLSDLDLEHTSATIFKKDTKASLVRIAKIRTYRISSRKYIIEEHLYGVIPLNMKTFKHKCSTYSTIRLLKAYYKKAGELPKGLYIPKDVAEYKDDAVFEKLCKDVRKVNVEM